MKCKTFGLIGVILASIPALATSITKTFTFSQNDLHWTQITVNGTTYDYPIHNDCESRISIPGAPTLPARVVTFAIPFDDYVTDLNVTSVSATTISGAKNILPGFDSHEDSTNTFFVLPDASYYIGTYPEMVAEFLGQDWMAGYHQAKVRLYPVAYDPGNEQTVLFTSITVELEVEDGPDPTVYPSNRDTIGGFYDIENFVKLSLQNPNNISSSHPTFTATGYKIRYLIICSEQIPGLMDEFQRLADWHTRMGIKTKVVSIQDAIAGQSGMDTQEKLRNFLQSKYTDAAYSLEYVLLAGDYGSIPPREVFRYTAPPNSTGLKTDRYYSDLDGGDWDDNDDGQYGFIGGRSNLHISSYNNTDAVYAYGCGCYQSTDGGETWSYVGSISGKFDYPSDLVFTSDTAGWVLLSDLNYVKVYQTLNGGSTWSLKAPCGGDTCWNNPKCISAYGNKAWIGGSEDTIYYYNGSSWSKQFAEGAVKGIDFVDFSHGWYIGGSDWEKIFKTSNSGSTWTQIEQDSIPGDIKWDGLCAVSADEVWVVGDKEYIIHTEDGGINWEVQHSNSTSYKRLSSIYFESSKDTGWAAGTHGLILYTYDSGGTWTPVSNPDYSKTFNDIWISSVDATVGMSVCRVEYPAIFRTESGPNSLSPHKTFINEDTSYNEIFNDVALGRVPVDDQSEAKAFVDKIIAYERGLLPGYLYDSMLLLITNWGGTNETKDLLDAEAMQTGAPPYSWIPGTDLDNFAFKEIYKPISGTGWSGSVELSLSKAIEELNKSYGIVIHADHGGGDWLCMGGGDQKMYGYDARHLHNSPSIFLAEGCYSGCYWLEEGHPGIEGFGEEMLVNNPTGGAVAYLGNVIPMYVPHGSDIRKHFLAYLFDSLDTSPVMTRPIGWAYNAEPNESESPIVFHLLGDPAMDVWTDTPDTLHANFSKQIDTSSQSFSVSATIGGNSAQYARVCLYKPGDTVYCRDKTTSTIGYTTYTIDPKVPGPMFVTITKHNARPYLGVCWVGDTTSKLNLSSETATRGYNARKIAVDDYGYIHLCYEDEVTKKYVVYAFSSDSGETWGTTEIKTLSLDCSDPALALGNGGQPYMAYLRGGYLYFRNLWSGKEKEIGNGQSYITQPSLAIDNRNKGWVGIRKDSYIHFFTFDAALVDSSTAVFNSSWCRLQPIAVTNDTETRPAGTGLASSALFVYSMNDTIYTYNPNFHTIPPQKVPDITGDRPTLDSWLNSLFMAYRNSSGDKVYAKWGWTNGSGIEWSTHEPVFNTSRKPKNPQCAGMNISVWDEGDPGSEDVFVSTKGSGWSSPSQLSPLNTVWAKYPQIDYNFDNGQSAVVWTQKLGDSCSIGFNPDPDSSWNRSDTSWANVTLRSPNAGDWLQLYSDYTVGWGIKTASNINPQKTILSFNYEDETPTSPSPETLIVDTACFTLSDDYYSENWQVGSYLVDTVKEGIRYRYYKSLDPPSPPDRTYQDCYFDARLYTDKLSPINDRNGSFVIAYRLWKLDPSVGPYPADTTKWKGNQPKWIYAGDIYETTIPGPLSQGDTLVIPWAVRSVSGFAEAKLEYSVDNGATWDTTNCIATSADSTLVDTLITSSNTLYRYDYCDTFYWLIPQEITSACLLQMIAEDSASRKDTITLSVPFPIGLSDITANSTRLNQRMIDVGKTAGKIGMVYQGEVSGYPIIYYTQSDKGWALEQPDSLGMGTYPVQKEGCVFWMRQSATSNPKDSIVYSGWDAINQEFTTSTIIANGAQQSQAVSVRYAVPDVTPVGDTVHMLTVCKIVNFNPPSTYYTCFTLERYRFLRNQPGSTTKDSISLLTVSGYDTTSLSTISAALQGSNLLLAMSFSDTCYYAKTPLAAISANDIRIVGSGFHPNASGSDGNITYTYLSPDSSSLIRLWRYRNDTVWVERDTVSLGYDASCISSSTGLLYGIQQSDSVLSHQYIYDPLSEQLLKEETYSGYFSHPFLDTDTSFNRVTSYTWEYDSASYCFMTDRTFLNGIYPALYIESDDRRSPYTVVRDTCIHYTEVDVDSASDSLKYVFPDLNTSNNYTLLVEFYTEADSATALQIKVGSAVDTLEIPGGGQFSWYETDIPSGTDSLKLTVKRISQAGFVPVSRVIVRHRTSADMYTMRAKGPTTVDPHKIAFCLYQPFPNPFTDAATIRFSVPYATRVHLKVYDITGRLVTKLVEGEVEAGVHTLRWEGRDDINRRCASGVYFVRFEADNYIAAKKMVMLK